MFSFNPSTNTNNKKTSNFWLFSIVNSAFALLIMTLITNMTIVLIWSEGLTLLKATYYQEVRYVTDNLDQTSASLISAWLNQSYNWLFVKSGIYDYFVNSQNPYLKDTLNTLLPVLQGAMIGFQIFFIRLSIIVLMLPFLAIVILVAASDGFLEWYKRRTSGARESAFIYHRSKHFFYWSLVLMWFAYLVPPFSVNPAYVFIPSCLIVAISSKLTFQYFKKYL